jgi:hypothetical protein
MTEKTVDIPPVSVTMIGTGPGTDLTGTLAVTPKGSPNLIIASVVTPLVAVLVRFGHTFGLSLIGLLTAALTPVGSSVLVPYTDLLTLVLDCSRLAATGAILGAIKDVVTIFKNLEGKFPLLTGNI